MLREFFSNLFAMTPVLSRLVLGGFGFGNEGWSAGLWDIGAFMDGCRQVIGKKGNRISSATLLKRDGAPPRHMMHRIDPFMDACICKWMHMNGHLLVPFVRHGSRSSPLASSSASPLRKSHPPYAVIPPAQQRPPRVK
jgi:hypothetical protein